MWNRRACSAGARVQRRLVMESGEFIAERAGGMSLLSHFSVSPPTELEILSSDHQFSIR